MPKIIENLQDRLIDEARRLAESGGDEAVTIRAVAAACGVGIGTVYNYFPNKEALMVAFLLRDWSDCQHRIMDMSQKTSDSLSLLRCIYQEILDFGSSHSAQVAHSEAISIFANTQNPYHILLLDHLARPLEKFCDSPLCARMAAELFLICVFSGESFDEFVPVLQKLFRSN